MDPGLTAALETLTDAGSKVLLALALIGGYRKWYVWWWQYAALKEAHDEWRSIAKQGLNIASEKK